ncbi:MAG: haloacid dehalogenase-like hydrolase, partial [Fusobacterium sp.]|nr:haloacid dehalogenase-like hydrolase [Fusobacterium sp.]
MIFQFLVTTIFAGGLLENGRWNPVNREKLEKLIEINSGKGNYVVFYWDYTSI